jgi:hypothetical protein
LEDRGLFDGGNIDKLCLQHIYMTMLRTHIHTFVQTHNTHRIRRQKQREHYLPTGIPVNMYQYPKPGAGDYGSPPNPETITALEHRQHLDKYDLDEYIPSTTRQILNDLLSAKVYPSRIPGTMTMFMHMVSCVLQYGTSSILGGILKFFYLHGNLRNGLPNMKRI